MKISDIFQCPKCQCNRLEEVLYGVTTTQGIESVSADGDTVYGPIESEGGETQRFQCQFCGWVVPFVETTADLHEFLTADDSPCKPSGVTAHLNMVRRVAANAAWSTLKVACDSCTGWTVNRDVYSRVYSVRKPFGLRDYTFKVEFLRGTADVKGVTFGNDPSDEDE
jgi:hypothetical protein